VDDLYNIALEELIDVYGIDIDKLNEVFNRIKFPSVASHDKSTKILARSHRPYNFSDKNDRNNFVGTKIGIRLASIFRHRIYKDFEKQLQNYNDNKKLQQYQEFIYTIYKPLETIYINDPSKLFQELRHKLILEWKFIPQYIFNETNQEIKEKFFKSDEFECCTVLIDLIILFGFLDCTLFSNTEAGEFRDS